MADTPKDWAALADTLRPHVSAEWCRHADEHGDQAWVRLVLLVDAHHFLSQPRIAEKVALTMADLAAGSERADERAGWEAINERAREDRVEAVARLVDAAPGVLPDELVPLFSRSIEPTTHAMT